MDDGARLPTLIIGGAPRSGTTLLCHVLDRHPLVYVAKPYIPEPKICMRPHPAGTAGYRRMWTELFAGGAPDAVLVEKTSYYLENEDALERLRLSVSDQARFLFIVREPVSRALSNYLWSRQNGLETLSFEEAVAREGTRASPLPPDRDYARPFDYLARGRYDVFAERYYAAFGRERVRFVLFEDVTLRERELFHEVQTFAGLEPLPVTPAEHGRINATVESMPVLAPAFEQRLRERMRPSVERFAALSGLDVGPWGY